MTFEVTSDAGQVHWGGTCVECAIVDGGYVILLLVLTALMACYLVLVPSKSVDLTGGIVRKYKHNILYALLFIRVVC